MRFHQDIYTLHLNHCGHLVRWIKWFNLNQWFPSVWTAVSGMILVDYQELIWCCSASSVLIIFEAHWVAEIEEKAKTPRRITPCSWPPDLALTPSEKIFSRESEKCCDFCYICYAAYPSPGEVAQVEKIFPGESEKCCYFCYLCYGQAYPPCPSVRGSPWRTARTWRMPLQGWDREPGGGSRGRFHHRGQEGTSVISVIQGFQDTVPSK